MDLANFNWKNILTNVGAVLVFAQTVYPGLNIEMIMMSISNGTFIQAIVNLALAYMLVITGNDKPMLNNTTVYNAAEARGENLPPL